MTGARSLTFSTTRRPVRRRWVRVVGGLVVIVLIAVVLLALAGGVLWTYAWAKLGGTEVPSLEAGTDAALGAGGASSPQGTTTVLVGLAEPSDGAGNGPIVGPVALVQVGGVRANDAAVVLLPPELTVNVDGEAPMPLAEVHDRGGPDLLVRAVVDYTQVEIDHVVTAAPGALPRLVEELGPIEACDPRCGDAATGDGAGAGAVREAIAVYTDPTTAPSEAADALRELAGALRGLGAATDPVGAIVSPLATRRAIDVLDAQLTTDVNFRGAALLPFADRLAAAGEVQVVALPGVRNPDSGELLVLPEQAATRFALLREGGVATRTPEDDAADLLSAATVSVQNGTGTAGYAASLETRVSALGVQVVGTENAASFDVDRTQVAYGPDDPAAEATAVLLARELGNVELVPLERTPTFEGDEVTVRIVGGTDLDTEASASDDQEP